MKSILFVSIVKKFTACWISEYFSYIPGSFPVSSPMLLTLDNGLWTGVFHFQTTVLRVHAWPSRLFFPGMAAQEVSSCGGRDPKWKHLVSELLNTGSCSEDTLGTAADSVSMKLSSLALNWVLSWLFWRSRLLTIGSAKWQEYYFGDEIIQL